MNDAEKARQLLTGAALLAAFALWTALIQLVDVRPVGQNGTDIGFAALGAVQFATRMSLLRVDPDSLLLGAYYVAVILFYLLFEAAPINYRPLPIDGVMEASYPSSTTLLVLSVMPTLCYQVGRRSNSPLLMKATRAFVIAFSAFMVFGRLVSGVHWATDIVGAVLLAFGLFSMYRFAVDCIDERLLLRKRRDDDGVQ